MRAPEFNDFYNGWADQQQNLLDSLHPLSSEQMKLRAAPGEWAIWQLASNMAGGRLYWLCSMLGEDDGGLSQLFKVDHTTVPGLSLDWAGWEDNEDRPRSAEELESAFHKTWDIVEACINRWSLDDLRADVSSKDAWGQMQTMTRASVVWRLMAHEVHHGSEISLILRVHGLPTAINR
ncbi:MAG: DinB family protein [Tepidiformaceae bacterium]